MTLGARLSSKKTGGLHFFPPQFRKGSSELLRVCFEALCLTGSTFSPSIPVVSLFHFHQLFMCLSSASPWFLDAFEIPRFTHKLQGRSPLYLLLLQSMLDISSEDLVPSSEDLVPFGLFPSPCSLRCFLFFSGTLSVDLDRVLGAKLIDLLSKTYTAPRFTLKKLESLLTWPIQILSSPLYS
jgi:hypothetical protein